MNYVSAKISTLDKNLRKIIVMSNHYRSDELFFYSKDLLPGRFDALLVS